MNFSATSIIGVLLCLVTAVGLFAVGAPANIWTAVYVLGGFTLLVVGLATISKWQYLTGKHRTQVESAARGGLKPCDNSTLDNSTSNYSI